MRRSPLARIPILQLLATTVGPRPSHAAVTIEQARVELGEEELDQMAEEGDRLRLVIQHHHHQLVWPQNQNAAVQFQIRRVWTKMIREIILLKEKLNFVR